MNNVLRTLIPLLVLSFVLSGCNAPYVDPRIDMQPPKYVEQMPSKEQEDSFGNQGSLFGKGKNPLFADRKAMRVHDIVTVVIQESANTSSSAQKSISKTNSNNLGGGVVGYGGESSTIDSLVNKVNKIGSLSFESGSESSFEGSGTNTRTEEFTTTISVRIIKVLENGNYFIQGSRELLIDGEKQMIQLSGVIRPYDIDQYNQIDSKYISDAKIHYTTQGDLKEVSEEGWASKTIKSVWPF